MYQKQTIALFIICQILSLTSIYSVNVAQTKEKSSLTSVEWDKYHNYTEIVNIVLELNATYPNIVDVFPVGKSWQNKTIYCLRLTNESTTRPRPAVLFVGYHHAREPITAELALYFAVYIATNAGTNVTINQMLNNSEIFVIAALNVDGFDAVTQNDWQRKNARPTDEDYDSLVDEDSPEDEDGDGKIEYLWNGYGYFVRWEGWDNDSDGVNGEDWLGGVDLNRNYGYAWNASADSGSPFPEDEDYRGPAPFSEVETSALRDLVMQYDFHYAVSLHSGADVILYPWGHTTDPTPHDYKYQMLASNISQLVNSPYQQSSQMYTTSGVWDDWMYGNQSVYSLTFEIYNDESAWTYEPGPQPYTYWIGGISEVFNPPNWGILETLQRWMPGLIYVADTAIEDYLPGDVNHDGSVDIFDVVALTSIYGSKIGSSTWNPKLDLIRDGKINIFDVVVVTGNYGKKMSKQKV